MRHKNGFPLPLVNLLEEGETEDVRRSSPSYPVLHPLLKAQGQALLRLTSYRFLAVRPLVVVRLALL